MKRFIFVPATTLLLLLFTLTAQAKTQLTYSNFFPPTHVNSQLAESWCREVEKRTHGEIIIKYFPASTLTRAHQTYDGVVQGIADIGMTVLAYSRGRFPVASAIDLPLGYSSGTQATSVANAVLKKFQPREFKDTQIMFLHAHGPGLIHTRDKEIRTLEDLKGLKLRGTGTSGKVQAALGASPVGKSMRECYQMLQRGVVDGSSHPIEANKGWKLGEVVHYMVQNFSTAYTTTFAVFMNKHRWNALTPEHQAIIQEINAQWALKHGEAWDEADAKGMAFFKAKGGKILPQTPDQSQLWSAQAGAVIAEYEKKASRKGVDGHAVVNFIKEQLQ